MNIRKRKKRIRLYIAAGIVIILIIVGFFIFRYVSMNLWIANDADQLKPYPRTLVENGKNLLKNEKPASERIHSIEQALIISNAKDRIVINLSRSEIRFNLLGNKAYVKIFLKTAIPGDRNKTTSIKFLNILRKTRSSWKVQTAQDLSIE